MFRRPCLALLLLCCLASSLFAQTSTGRHRRTETVEQQPESVSGGEESRWAVTVGAGLLSSGDLFRVRTAGTSGIPWDPPAGTPFLSDDFTVTLDESFALSVSLGRRLGSRLWVRLDVSTGQVDMAAVARVGESAEVFRWDQLALHQGSLELEYRLIAEPSFPYVLGGASGVVARGGATDAIDQEQVGFRFGAGFQQRLARDWGLRFEIRDTIVGLDFAGYRPPVVGDAVYPDFTLEDEGPQHLWELLLGLNGSF